MEPIAVIRGTVVHGKGLGRTVGMYTANLAPEKDSMIPADGVYASIVMIGNERYIGVTNIGRRPTVATEERRTIETNIIGFFRDIYGVRIELRIMRFLRPIRRMESLLKVREQVDEDRKRAVSLLSSELMND